MSCMLCFFLLKQWEMLTFNCMYAVFLLVETMGDTKIADLTLTFIAVWLLLEFCFACFLKVTAFCRI